MMNFQNKENLKITKLIEPYRRFLTNIFFVFDRSSQRGSFRTVDNGSFILR